MDKKNEDMVPNKCNVEESNIPNPLKSIKSWGLWQWQWNKQWTKVPVSPGGSPIDAKNFCFSFKKALKYYETLDFVSGLGFHFSKDHDIFGIDFDDCIIDGRIEKTVKKKLKLLDSYWEKSPSGTGIHAICSGSSLLNGVDRKFVYDNSRYFTFTGQGKGKLRNAGKEANKLFGLEKKIDQPTTGTQESDIRFEDLQKIVTNIKPNLPEPDWFIVCKVIHFKTNGSEEGKNLFVDWSAGKFCKKKYRYKEFNEQDCLRKWNRCKIGERNVGLPQLRNVESYYAITTEKKSIKNLFAKSLEQLEYNKYLLNLDHIPKSMRTAAEEIARFNKVSVDPVITTMLMVFSAAINKKVKIVERDGLSHNCSMGCIIGMPSGGRKSAIDRPLIYPFKQYEKRLMQEWEKGNAQASAEIKVLKKQYAKAENDETLPDEDKITRMAAIQNRINKLSRVRPKLIESDATEEKLSDSLYKNDEVMFIHSDDARNTIKNITGRYDNSSENIYITGLTGDTYRRSRVKDDIEIVLYNPCINLCLKVQLDLLRELVTKTSMRESGLLARMFIKVLDDNVAEQFRENEKEDDLNYVLLEDYDSAISKVLDYDGNRVLVTLSDDARKRRIEFSNQYANMLENEWSTYKDISNKIVSLSVKMATVITVMKHPGILEKSKNKFGIAAFEIQEKEYIAGKEIVMVLMQQTLDVLNKLEQNDIIKGAIILYEKMKKDKKNLGIEEWTNRTLIRKLSHEQVKKFGLWITCLIDNGILIEDDGKYRMV